MRGHLCRTAWRGKSASGGRDAGRQSLRVHSLLHPEIRPWHLSMGQGPLRRVPVSVRRPLPPVSPAARVRFNSLNVPHSVSQDTCPPIQTYLTLELRDRLQKACEKPRVGPVPLRSAQEGPWPCRWNTLCCNKVPVPHLPCVPGLQPRVGHTVVGLCVE